MQSFRQQKMQLLIDAQKGDPLAQMELGLLYKKGSNNTPPNYAAAKRWLVLAQKNGIDDADIYLKSLIEIETPLKYKSKSDSSYNQNSSSAIKRYDCNHDSKNYKIHRLNQFIPPHILRELNEIIGLTDIKSQISDVIISLKYKLRTFPLQIRKKISIDT